MDIEPTSKRNTMRAKTRWEPGEIRSRLPSAGGIGFLFHATNHSNISFCCDNVSNCESDIWAFPPIIAGPTFFESRLIGAHLASPIFPELWAGSHAGIRRFRNEGYLPLLRLAEASGLTHVGLAALIPFATQFGEFGQHERKLVATTGHAATVAAMEMILAAVCARCGLALNQISVGIFGSAGSIGSMTAKWLVHRGVRQLILVDVKDRLRNLYEFAGSLRSSYTDLSLTVLDAEEVANAPDFDAGLIATNKASPWLKADVLRKAAVWIDDSHPRAVEPEAEHLLRDQVVCLECFLRGPHGLCQTVPFKLPTPRDCYSCFAELFICWREGMESDFVTGRPTIEQITLIERLFSKHGFSVGPYSDKSGCEIQGNRLNKIFEIFREKWTARNMPNR